MPAAARDQDLEQRLASLEQAMTRLGRHARGFDSRLLRLEATSPLPRARAGALATQAGHTASQPPRPAHESRQVPLPAHESGQRPLAPAPGLDRASVEDVMPVRTRASALSLSDLVGGRVLAWIGGIATLLGIVLFLALAISRGWIGVEARVALAGVASSALMAVGIWLHDRRGRTEASVVIVGVATAGLFATLVVAGEIYHLIAPLLAVGGSMLVGALATTLAIRWAGQAIGAVGLLGGLASPVLVRAPIGAATVAMLGVAAGCAIWAVVSQRWGWLALATVVICAAQWGSWILRGEPVLVDLAVLVWFTGLGIAGAMGERARSAGARLAPSAAALVVLNVVIVGVVGRIALDDAASAAVGDLWLGALAAVHGAIGLSRSRRLPISESLRRVLIALGVILADVAFGLSASGITLALGWGATAVVFAWLSRRTLQRENDEALLGLGVGAHIALTLIRVLFDAPLTGLQSADVQLPSLLSIATLAGSCLASAHLVGQSRPPWVVALNAVGLAAIAYLTAQALDGFALVATFAFEAAALTEIARRSRDNVARYGALGFLALAIVHVLTVEAPPVALLTGVSSVGAAAVALAAIAVAMLRVGLGESEGSRSRGWLIGGAAGALLYLGSVEIITAFQPTGAADDTLLDLSVRQQGQVLLSACWTLVGLLGLIVGLRRNHAPMRTVALGLLLVAVGKVFLYDLSTLTSIYRVISFIALGLLLLSGAFAYQRLRPPPIPDMRTVHPSQR